MTVQVDRDLRQFSYHILQENASYDSWRHFYFFILYVKLQKSTSVWAVFVFNQRLCNRVLSGHILTTVLVWALRSWQETTLFPVSVSSGNEQGHPDEGMISWMDGRGATKLLSHSVLGAPVFADWLWKLHDFKTKLIASCQWQWI